MKKYSPRLKQRYIQEIKLSLKNKLNIKNQMDIPNLSKIILNMGIGDAKDNKNSLEAAVQELSIISGQKAVKTFSTKAISNFKIRENDPVGVKVTLRSNNMWEFLDRFISIVSPRIRDFQGLASKGFDGRGNYNFGLTEQIVFPEIDYDKVNSIRGMNITIVTSTNNDMHSYELLHSLGMPIKEKNK